MDDVELTAGRIGGEQAGLETIQAGEDVAAVTGVEGGPPSGVVGLHRTHQAWGGASLAVLHPFGAADLSHVVLGDAPLDRGAGPAVPEVPVGQVPLPPVDEHVGVADRLIEPVRGGSEGEVAQQGSGAVLMHKASRSPAG